MVVLGDVGQKAARKLLKTLIKVSFIAGIVDEPRLLRRGIQKDILHLQHKMPRIQQVFLQIFRRAEDPAQDRPEDLRRNPPLLQIDPEALAARHVIEQHGFSVHVFHPAIQKARDPVGGEHISVVGIPFSAGRGNRHIGMIQYSFYRKSHHEPFPASAFTAFAFRIVRSGLTFS